MNVSFSSGCNDVHLQTVTQALAISLNDNLVLLTEKIIVLFFFNGKIIMFMLFLVTSNILVGLQVCHRLHVDGVNLMVSMIY